MSLCTTLYVTSVPLCAVDSPSQSLSVGPSQATISLISDGDLRTYHLSTNADLRDNVPPSKEITISEATNHAHIRTGNILFDGLYAMANAEAQANSVSQISDGSYNKGTPIQIDAFQTGESWKYVWTRDLSYSLDLALAGFDPDRAVDSLLFKASVPKPTVVGGFANQIIQDTGSGGSYPVSTDRVIWAMGAAKTMDYLAPKERQDFLAKIYPILCDTIEQDRQLVFDPKDGLYRGEQSFLDWREQTYPGWTKANVLPIAMSKALSVNAANYFLLKTAADYSGQLGHKKEQSKYAAWADDLKLAINRNLYDPKAGLYRSYLLSDDGSFETPVDRYDLLGESLAILFGVADQDQARSIIKNYPTGPFGPPVVWPQEKSVPIYHNQSIWPFVTAYWVRAAQKARNTKAVDAGVQSLQELAALNLSNMENYDFVTGQAHSTDSARKGPVIDSRRQLWSVAAYLSMVQDTVFGLETSANGIRFLPYITAQLRNDTFHSADTLELKNFVYQGTRNEVTVHLPTAGSFSAGACVLDHVELNGKQLADGFVGASSLQRDNVWNVFLKAPTSPAPDTALHLADVTNEKAYCGPLQPTWQDGPYGGLEIENGHIALNYREDSSEDVTFNIYRDGQLCASGIRDTKWVDTDSADYQQTVHSYAVAAVDALTSTVSHLTPSRSLRTDDQKLIIGTKDIQNKGGNLVTSGHFENWGAPADELTTSSFQVKQRGQHLIRVQFANGAGPINTGITCAVKKLEILKAGSGEAVASGYLVMPQSGDWTRWDMSSSISAYLDPNEKYTIHIFEDTTSRNMSYMKSNNLYTAGVGGGDKSSNYVNVASVYVLFANANPSQTLATASANQH